MFTINSPALLAATCRIYLAGRISERIFHASVCEAARLGVDWRSALSAAGIDPATLPRYASLVA